MDLLKIQINDFRNLYLNNNEFVIMIRDENDPINKNTKNDIVYFNGIKAFEIEKNKNQIKNIIIKDNIYKINTTNVKNNSKEKIIKSIETVRNKISEYLPLKLTKIEFQTSKNHNLFDDAKNKFINDISKYIKMGYTDGKIKLKETSKTKIYFIEFNQELLKNDMNAMLEIEYSFIKNFKISENGKEPYIIKNIKFIFDNLKDKTITKIKDINKFNDTIKECINNYEKLTKEELEKKYQHQFMLSTNTLKKLDVFKNLYRFEEEYYTDESKKDENQSGRIDCLFLEINKDILTDIYLIELKVNENVLGNSNGIHKHLIDIENLLKNKDKKMNFIYRLHKRVSYRREVEQLNKLKELEEECYENIKFHFYTIIAFADTSNNKTIKDHALETFKLINSLDNPEYIKNNRAKTKEEYKEKNMLPCESEILSNHLKRLKESLKCDTKIYYDIYWNKKDITDKQLIDIDSINDESKLVYER